MQIKSITPFHVAIPYEHGAPKPVTGTGAVRTAMEAVYLRVDTDAGVTGWGECFGFGACAITAAAVRLVVAPLAIGRDAATVAETMHDLRRRTQSMGLNGPVGFALSGLDIALWDIAGKLAGAPVYRLLGGDQGGRIPAYASLLRLAEPRYIESVCTEAVARGYRHVKLHERTLEAVAAARRTIGPHIGLMLDTNCTFTPAAATAFAEQSLAYDLAWFEEPVYPADDYESLAALRRVGIPVAAGENLGNVNEARRIVSAGAVDVLQPDACKIGGITEAWKVLSLALEAGIAAEPHAPYYGPGLIAALHMIAAMPGHALCEYYFADLAEQPLGGAAVVRDGYLTVPDGPGLGISVDQTLLERYHIG